MVNIAIGSREIGSRSFAKITVVPGPEQVESMVDSTRLSLTKDDLAQIEALVPRGAAHGQRYPAALMAELDSER